MPKFDTKHVLDGERKMQFLKPLPVSSAGRKFEVRSKVLGVYDKGKPGTVVETEQRLVDAETGETYTRAVGSGFYVGQGGWGGPKGMSTNKHPSPSLSLSILLTTKPSCRSQGPQLPPSLPQPRPHAHPPNHHGNRAPVPPKRRLQPPARRP